MCRNNIPYLLNEHTERFYKNCSTLCIKVPLSEGELQALICELVKRVDGDEKFVYFHVSRGEALRAHSATPSVGSLCIMITPQKLGDISEQMSATLVEDVRYELCNIKTLNLLPNVLAAKKAEAMGTDEAIFHRNGIVTEGSHCNISILVDGCLVTAPADSHILPGVTRRHLINEAKMLGIKVIESKYTVKELFLAQEVMLTSSSKMLRGINKIDGIEVGGKNKELLLELQSRLLNDYLNSTK